MGWAVGRDAGLSADSDGLDHALTTRTRGIVQICQRVIVQLAGKDSNYVVRMVSYRAVLCGISGGEKNNNEAEDRNSTEPV